MTALVVCLYLLAFAIGLGILVSVIVVVPIFFYTFPYACWCGWADADNKYPSTKGCGFWRSARNATKLYQHWFFHKRLDF